MSMRISPGYNFQTNEVPTRAKFQLMLAGASLTGIAISQIDATLVVQSFTSSTGLSLPAEGFLDYDQNGFLWVRGRHGHVHLWRGNWGGWETRRYPVYAPLDTITLPNAANSAEAMLRAHTAGNTTESAVGWRHGTALGRLTSIGIETGVSGVHTRWVVRGGRSGPMPIAERVPANLKAGGSPDYMLRTAASSSDHNATGFPAQAGGAEGTGRKQALLLWQSSAGGSLMWVFGLEFMQD